MPNLHSHAFQRALAGRTGRAAAAARRQLLDVAAGDVRMLERLDAEDFAAVTAQAYVEMAKAGYGAVAEFHYVHHDPAGRPYQDPAPNSRSRVVGAAREAGLALTLLPVSTPTPGSAARRRSPGSGGSCTRRTRSPGWSSGWSRRGGRHRRGRRGRPAQPARGDPRRTPRSRRRGALRRARAHPRRRADCARSTTASPGAGRRPVEWLLSHARVDARWCLVHATHMTTEEMRGAGGERRRAGLAPTTEADLGDGIFAGDAFSPPAGASASAAIRTRRSTRSPSCGSSSGRSGSRCGRRNVLAGAARAWGRRCGSRRRATARAPADARPACHRGRTTRRPRRARCRRAGAGGAGGGRRAGRGDFRSLPATGARLLAGGRFIVREGRHRSEETVLARFRAALARMAAA